ncbi:MAG: hypothetical protein LQ343_003498 [Gyalolechia ehrenbergii]|nr:MAG: hypothetical protein LQ343_003498 [Gyalolechia ehrenbergii]
MSLGSVLRARKDMEAQHSEDPDEAAYLLTPSAEQNDRLRRSRYRSWNKSLSLFLTRHTRSIPMLCLGIFAFFFIFSRSQSLRPPRCVDTPERGYQCEPQISHYLGQYSPFFPIPSDSSNGVPKSCTITFAQILSRHGARDPTASKTEVYNNTIQKLKANVNRFSGKYHFLNTFVYSLGADQLTTFGEQEMVNSGIAFYNRYEKLAQASTPFIRSSGEARVVVSAQNFSQGFHEAKTSKKVLDADYPYPVLVVPESKGSNNTLDHELCTAFESGEPYRSISSKAQQTFLATFLPSITTRLNADLVSANLTATDTINLMDLCPFATVASPIGAISSFCYLFTEDEWHYYNYYQTLGKYYGYGPGNPLGPTQGVGFVNELIARMTGKAVNDHTTVNHTLDDSNETFPLGDILYVDVSHDNDMTAIFSALGLYNSTPPLSNTTIGSTRQTNGYSAAWTVPFAGRANFEKMECQGVEEELVRIIVNGRVMPLETCGGDSLGRCTLSRFIDSQSFAAAGGKWDQCFIS